MTYCGNRSPVVGNTILVAAVGSKLPSVHRMHGGSRSVDRDLFAEVADPAVDPVRPRSNCSCSSSKMWPKKTSGPREKSLLHFRSSLEGPARTYSRGESAEEMSVIADTLWNLGETSEGAVDHVKEGFSRVGVWSSHQNHKTGKSSSCSYSSRGQRVDYRRLSDS